MDTGISWEIVALLCSACSALGTAAGAGLKTIGDRIKLVYEDRQCERSRQVSEMDMWQKIGAMEQRINDLTEELKESRKENAELRVEVAVLRQENAQLRDSLSAMHIVDPEDRPNG
jgi:predicted RNase H-like nuclease (RuvC/YqgF family)